MENRLFDVDDGMDEDTCLAMYDNSYDFYRLVLETFCKEITRTRESLKVMFGDDTTEDYRVLVHGLKGSGGSVGAVRLVELATKSNALIKEGKWEEAKELHEPIIDELTRLIELIPDKIR